MGLLKKLAGQTAVYGISSVLGRVLTLILTPFYTGVFAPEVYGHFTELYTWIALFNVALIFGMETTFFRFTEGDKDDKTVYSQVFIWVGGLASLFLILGLSLYSPLANLLSYEAHSEWVALTLIIIFFDVLVALPMARLRHQEKVMRFAIINLINIFLLITLNFFFILGLDKGLTFVFVANIIASALRFGMALWGNLPSTLKPDKTRILELVHYGLFIMIAQLAGMMTQAIDRILIPRLWEDGTLFEGVPRLAKEMNGLYGANYKVAMLIALATQAFRYAVEPFFFKHAKDNKSPETFAKVFHYYVIAALTGFLLVGSFAKEIVSFNFFGLLNFTFLNEDYWSALAVVPILLLAYVMNGAYVNLSIWFKITKQVRFAILFSGVGAILAILINLFTIPTYGYMGSAWATLIAFTTMCVMVYVVGQKYYPIPYRINRILLYGAIFILAFFLNKEIGPTDGYFLAFLVKFVICSFAIGLVAVGEKMFPVFGEA